MKTPLSLSIVLGLLVLCAAAHAQQTTQILTPGQTVTPSQIVAPGATVTTTVEAPAGTTTTMVATTGGQSMMTRQKDGAKLELDSDGSVYVVYADGARVTATDGIHTLMDGTNITVKDGKRIP